MVLYRSTCMVSVHLCVFLMKRSIWCMHHACVLETGLYIRGNQCTCSKIIPDLIFQKKRLLIPDLSVRSITYGRHMPNCRLEAVACMMPVQQAKHKMKTPSYFSEEGRRMATAPTASAATTAGIILRSSSALSTACRSRLGHRHRPLYVYRS